MCFSFLQIKYFSFAITLRNRESIISWVIIKIIKKVKIKIDFEKTWLKKFDKKVAAEIKLIRDAILTVRIRLIQA